MRKIKFRGKRVDNGEWVYGDLVCHYENQRRFITCDQMAYTYTECGIDRLVSERFCEVNPSTIGQYTGLKDKNRTEIYEGDVMGGPSQLVTLRGNLTSEYTETRFVVEWDEKKAKFTARQTYDSRYPDFYATRKASTELTIIADYHPIIDNIHDNPELLGGAE